MPAATASALTALTALVAACVLPAFVGTALRPIGLERRKVNWETPRLPKVRRNAGNFEVIDAVLKSTPDVEAEVESRDPKLMRWKVVWKVAQTAEVPAGQFGYQVMLQQTDKNKEYFSLQSAFRRPSALQPGDALIFANQGVQHDATYDATEAAANNVHLGPALHQRSESTVKLQRSRNAAQDRASFNAGPPMPSHGAVDTSTGSTKDASRS